MANPEEYIKASPDDCMKISEYLFDSYETAIRGNHVLGTCDVSKLTQDDIDRIVSDLGGIAWCLRTVIATIAARGLMEMDK